jgi:hypothetical protein
VEVELVVVESPAIKKLANELMKLEVVEKRLLEVAKVSVEFWVTKLVPELVLKTELLAKKLVVVEKTILEEVANRVVEVAGKSTV